MNNNIEYDKFKRSGIRYRQIDDNYLSGKISNIVFQKNSVLRISRLSTRRKSKNK